MKIAIIDTGIKKEEINSNLDVKHFCILKGEIVNEYQKPIDNHGTECFKEILANTKTEMLQILDLNILKDGENLNIKNIVIAIEKAIEERADIINISLGTKSFSQELYDICEQAVYNNSVIVAASSHTNTISFPADFNNVISVKVDQNQAEKIRKIDESTIAINMKDFIITEEGEQFDFSSSSLACARFCGCLCDDFGDKILVDKFKILSSTYKINLYDEGNKKSSVTLMESEYQKVLRNHRIAVVIFPLDRMKKEDYKFFHKNIVAYYNHEKCDFYNWEDDKPSKDFDTIMIINTLYCDFEIPVDIQEKYKGYEVIYVGNFLNIEGNKYLQEYKTYKASELAILEKPVIAITSLCSGLNKGDIQRALLKSLETDGLNIGTVTNNPIGMLYNANVFNFPEKVKFPDIVYSINRFMYLYEVDKNIDAWLINIGGGLAQVNALNTYNFGKLVDAYLSAANIDIVVVCVTPSVDIDFLKLQISYLYKNNVGKVLLVLSHNDINGTTMDYKDGLQTYYIDDEKYECALEELKKNMEEDVFGLLDVEKGKLYETIIKTLA